MVKKIKFVISKTGQVSMDVDGVVGSSCEEFTEAFENELGEVESREHKDSYYQESSQEEKFSSSDF